MNILRKLTPKGRLTRTEFWLFFFLYLLLCLPFWGAAYEAFNKTLQTDSVYATIGPLFFICVPYFCLFYPIICKRLHDIGKSSSTFWLITFVNSVLLSFILTILYIFIDEAAASGARLSFTIDYSHILTILLRRPFIITLILNILYSVYFFLDSQPGENKYGKSIKYPDAPCMEQSPAPVPAVQFCIITYALIIILTIIAYCAHYYFFSESLYYYENYYIISEINWQIGTIVVGICAYKNGYSFFSYLSILFLILSMSYSEMLITQLNFNSDTGQLTLTATSEFAYLFLKTFRQFLECYLAVRVIGILQNNRYTTEHGIYHTQPLIKRHPNRVLGFVFLLLLLIAYFSYKMPRLDFDVATAILNCPLLIYIVILFTLKWIYEYLRYHQYTKTKSITIAVAVPLIFTTICIFLTSDSLIQYFWVLQHMFTIFLFMACFIFAPTSPIFTEGQNASTLRAKHIHLICCIITILLSIISCAILSSVITL